MHIPLFVTYILHYISIHTMHSQCSLCSLHFFSCHLVFMSGMCGVCVWMWKKIYTRKTTPCNTHWIYEETFAMTTKHLELFASFVSGKWHQNAQKKSGISGTAKYYKNSECWVEMTGQKTDWDSRRTDMVEKRSSNIDVSRSWNRFDDTKCGLFK